MAHETEGILGIVGTLASGWAAKKLYGWLKKKQIESAKELVETAHPAQAPSPAHPPHPTAPHAHENDSRTLARVAGDLSERIHELKADNAEQTKRIDHLEAQSRVLQRILEETETERESLRTDIEYLRNENDKIRHDRDAARAAATRTMMEVRRLKIRVAELERTEDIIGSGDITDQTGVASRNRQ